MSAREVALRPRRLPLAAAVAALAVVLLLLVSGFTGLASAAPLPPAPQNPTPAGTPSSSPGAPPPARTHATSPMLPFGPPSANASPGLFFVQHPTPLAPATHHACIYSYACIASANDPSMNLTTNGVLAVAYTSYTNETHCANMSATAESSVAVVTSTNGGKTWSAPSYQSNTDCGHAKNFVNSWEPSLTSLSNGTLVLVYIQFGLTAYSTLPYTYFGPYSWNVISARLVVTISYDNGTTWGGAHVLNQTVNGALSIKNWIPMRPWVTAYGQTVYVTWMNYTEAMGSNYSVYPPKVSGSSQVHLLVSTNGGRSFGAIIGIKSFAPDGGYIGMNPFVMTTPSGRLLIAYVTNVSLAYPYLCPPVCIYGIFTGSVELASSATNGSSFTYTSIADVVPIPTYSPTPNSNFALTAPQLAYSPVTGQLFAVFESQFFYRYCYVYGCYWSFTESIQVTNSSTVGSSWARFHDVSPAFQALGGNGFYVYNPSIATDAKGIVHVEAAWHDGNSTVCVYGYYCPTFGVYLNSSNNASSFNGPYILTLNVSYFPNAPDGEYGSLLAPGTTPIMAWSQQFCSTSYCYYPSASGGSIVEVSTPFNGTGVNLTFREHGLRNGTTWGIGLMGNTRVASAPSNLTVSGVPAAEVVTWNLSSPRAGYGILYTPVQSVLPPRAFNASQNTLYENYTEQVFVNISSNPDIPLCGYYYYSAYCWNNAYGRSVNYNFTPGPTAVWVTPGTSFSESVVPNAPYCGYYSPCYQSWEWLKFQSWTGAAANTNATNITFTANGPVNETANFRVVGFCYINPYSASSGCTAINTSIDFHESGLPAGTAWTVTASGWGGITNTTSSQTPWVVIASNLTVDPVNFTVWSIPDGTTGLYWVASTTPHSPVEIPSVPTVLVNFTLVDPTSAKFPVTVRETGLPNATGWSVSLNNVSYGVQNQSLFDVVSGGGLNVNASSVFLTNGTSYYPATVTFAPMVVGASWSNTSGGTANLKLVGPGLVLVNYQPEYWVTVNATSGGTVTPSSQWVHNGASTTLQATSSPGFFFVGWTGSGSGAKSSSNGTLKVSPAGPVTELATFEPIPPPLWNVTVTAAGLPAGTMFTLTLGNETYSGGATFAIDGLKTGAYLLSIPYGFLNSSMLTRFLPSIRSTTFSWAAPGLLSIGSNGWINVSFETQYSVAVAATGMGSVSPVPGSYWVAAGATFDLVATPQTHYRLIAWNGSGAGSVSGTALGIAPVANGPLWETAQFVYRIYPPNATFSLTVSESGLPVGVPWNVSVGSTGASSSRATVTIGGLNGTYTLLVAPVYTAAGTRYVLSPNASVSQAVVSNRTVALAFVEQFLLTISSSAGGTLTPGTEWLNAGTVVVLSATPSNASWAFASWNGTGSSGLYTGTNPNATVAMTGPVTEVGNFAPLYPVKKTGSSTQGQPIAFGLLAVLLAVGLVVGLLVGRRRAPPSGSAADSPPDAESDGSESGASDEASLAAPQWEEGASDVSDPNAPGP